MTTPNSPAPSAALDGAAVSMTEAQARAVNGDAYDAYIASIKEYNAPIMAGALSGGNSEGLMKSLPIPSFSEWWKTYGGGTPLTDVTDVPAPPVQQPSTAPSDYQGGASASPLAAVAATPTPAAVQPEVAPPVVISHPDQITPAITAPSTEAETHVLVQNDHASALKRWAAEALHGVEGAAEKLAHGVEHLFHHAA